MTNATDQGRGRSAQGPIPAFASREEEATFWDSHDVADYQEEFQTVRARVARHLSEGITIRLDKVTLAELRAKAQEQGLGPTTLARLWILERLKQHRAS